jgi:hypothetical protein
VVAADTSPDAHARQLEILHRLDPTERVRVAAQMSDDARSIALAGIAARRPDLDRAGRIRELIRLIYGVEIEPGSPIP